MFPLDVGNSCFTVIQSKAPEQPLNGPSGETVLSTTQYQKELNLHDKNNLKSPLKCDPRETASSL